MCYKNNKITTSLFNLEDLRIVGHFQKSELLLNDQKIVLKRSLSEIRIVRQIKVSIKH